MGNQAAALRALLNENRILVAPGVVDAMSARVAAANGFAALYMTGSGVAATLGFPDMGVVTLTEQVNQARCITRSIDIPLIADAESGFGDLLSIKRTVQEYENAGVAAFHLEDQLPGVLKVAHTIPIERGNIIAPDAYAARASGLLLFPPEAMAARIAVAVAARQNRDTVIIARTDAMPMEGIDAAIARGNIYADAGADLIFVQQPRTLDEAKTLAQGLKVGLVASITRMDAKGITTHELSEVGVKVALCPTQGLRIALNALDAALAQLKTQGTFHGMADAMMPVGRFRELTGEAAEAKASY